MLFSQPMRLFGALLFHITNPFNIKLSPKSSCSLSCKTTIASALRPSQPSCSCFIQPNIHPCPYALPLCLYAEPGHFLPSFPSFSPNPHPFLPSSSIPLVVKAPRSPRPTQVDERHPWRRKVTLSTLYTVLSQKHHE